jgi:hypothetical protein
MSYSFQSIATMSSSSCSSYFVSKVVRKHFTRPRLHLNFRCLIYYLVNMKFFTLFSSLVFWILSSLLPSLWNSLVNVVLKLTNERLMNSLLNNPFSLCALGKPPCYASHGLQHNLWPSSLYRV